MFEASKRLDEEDEDGKPSVAVLFGGAKKKPRYNPSAKLDDDEGGPDGGDDPKARFTEACDIMARMINAGRVDSEKLGQCLRKAFEALEEEPHAEGEHTNEGEG